MRLQLLALIIPIALGPISLDARTWTSSAGSTIEAELETQTATHVTLKRDEDGRRITLPIDQLSAEDQAFITNESTGISGGEPALPDEVAEKIAARGELLFEDKFDREDSDEKDDLGPDWTTNSDSRAQGDKQADLVDGTLVMTISPNANHAISNKHHTVRPYADAVTYVRMRLDDETDSLKLAFNDISYKEVHAGHINGVTITPTSITLDDEKNGRFSAAAMSMKDDPGKKEELTELTKSYQKKIDIELALGEWHDVVVVHEGSVLTAYIDGEEVATSDSPGFAHETKQQFVFAVPKHAVADEVRMWTLKKTE